MTVPPSATCPACNQIVSDDDEVCAHCGVPIPVFRIASRTPLILPGNPALSDDDTSTGTPAARGVGATVLGLAVVGAIALVMTREPAPRDVAASATVDAAATASDTAAPATDVASAGLINAMSARTTSAPAPAVAMTRATTDSSATPQQVAPIPSAVADAPVERPVAPRVAAPAVAPATAIKPATTPTRSTPTVVASATPTKPAPTAVVSAVPAKIAPAKVTPTVVASAAPTPVAAPAEPPKPAAPVPVLHLVPLVSHSLRTGEIVRIRGTIQDLTSGNALPTEIRYTSADPRIARVDARTGEVTGVSAGRVRIVADAGNAGKQTIDLLVQAIPKPVAPTVAPTVVAAARTPLPQPIVALPTTVQRTAAKPTAAQIAAATTQLRADSAAARSAAAARAVATRPVTPSSIAPVANTGSAISPQVLRDVVRPDAGDTRDAASRIASELLSGSHRTTELTQFFTDGASHRVAIIGAPANVGETPTGVRVTFELRLTKFDAGGRPVTRIIPVQMDVAKREGNVSTTGVALGALRRP